MGHGVNGAFSYDIRFEGDTPEKRGLSVVYGENGTGKSTLLSSVYHLLTPGPRHLAALARAEISYLSIELDNGGSLSYSAPDQSARISLVRTEDDFLEVDLNEVLDDRGLRRHQKYAAIFDYHSSITVPVIFVSDDRSVSVGDHVAYRSRQDLEALTFSEMRELSASGELLSRMRSQEIEGAVARAEETLRQAAMAGMSKGGSNTQSMYVQLIRELDRERKMLTGSDARSELEAKIAEVTQRGGDYSAYGLLGLDQVQAISRELRDLRQNSAALPVIHRVVGPYLDSLLVQINALQEAKDFIDAYVRSINSFVARKSFSFHMAKGASLELSADKRSIPLAALSSGEKHLVLLLSYAVVARETQGLFIIDEPELSLGLDWRRKLVPALLSCADPDRAQFLMASHAVEIVAQYEDMMVSPLESTS